MNDIKDEIKGNIVLRGWTMTELVTEINRKRKLIKKKSTTISNISNKIKRNTIKYTEVKEIAEIIGSSIEWK